MYFKIDKDEEEINKYINKAFVNICDVFGLESNTTMGKFSDMYCNANPEESIFTGFLLTFKLLYTSSYIFNINILDSISSVLNNTSHFKASTHKILLILLYTLIYYLYKLIAIVNLFLAKLIAIKIPKPIKISTVSFGTYIRKSFTQNLISFIFFILILSIFLNVIKYIYDIGVGISSSSKLRMPFFVQLIMLTSVLIFSGIFNAKKKTSTSCTNNSKYLITILFLIIPVITGIQQFTTIIYRGIKGMFSINNSPQLKILFTTIFIMVLVLFNIDVLTNLANKPITQIV